MLDAIGDSLSDLASSSGGEDRDDKEVDEHTELGRFSEDDEPGGVIDTISKRYSTA